MPTEFEKAFAEARKNNLKTFDFGGKKYTTQLREDKVLEDILTENPAMAKVYNRENTVISLADKKRQELNKKYGGGGALEHWFPDDEGAAEFPHPTLGKYNLEFYNENLYKDTPKMKAAVYLDMLHGMKADPEYKAMRDEFNKNWKKSELEWIKKKHAKEAYKGESLAKYVDRTVLDGYLRGALNPMDDASLKSKDYYDEYAQMYRGQIKENGKVVDPYSPKQREIVAKMQEYLKSGGNQEQPKQE